VCPEAVAHPGGWHRGGRKISGAHGRDPRPAKFRPILFYRTTAEPHLYPLVRTGNSAAAAVQQMDQAVRNLGPGLALYSSSALESPLDVTYFQARAAAWVQSVFGVNAASDRLRVAIGARRRRF